MRKMKLLYIAILKKKQLKNYVFKYIHLPHYGILTYLRNLLYYKERFYV